MPWLMPIPHVMAIPRHRFGQERWYINAYLAKGNVRVSKFAGLLPIPPVSEHIRKRLPRGIMIHVRNETEHAGAERLDVGTNYRRL